MLFKLQNTVWSYCSNQIIIPYKYYKDYLYFDVPILGVHCFVSDVLRHKNGGRDWWLKQQGQKINNYWVIILRIYLQ